MLLRFYTFISRASMILDDCLMIITSHLPFHEYCLLSTSISHNNLSLQALYIVNSFAVHIFPFVFSYLACSSHCLPFSSQLGLQLDLFSCSSVLVRDTKPFDPLLRRTYTLRCSPLSCPYIN
jgi:hypothetical protein